MAARGCGWQTTLLWYHYLDISVHYRSCTFSYHPSLSTKWHWREMFQSRLPARTLKCTVSISTTKVRQVNHDSLNNIIFNFIIFDRPYCGRSQSSQTASTKCWEELQVTWQPNQWAHCLLRACAGRRSGCSEPDSAGGSGCPVCWDKLLRTKTKSWSNSTKVSQLFLFCVCLLFICEVSFWFSVSLSVSDCDVNVWWMLYVCVLSLPVCSLKIFLYQEWQWSASSLQWSHCAVSVFPACPCWGMLHV